MNKTIIRGEKLEREISDEFTRLTNLLNGSAGIQQLADLAKKHRCRTMTEGIKAEAKARVLERLRKGYL